MSDVKTQTYDPAHASFRRKTFGLRVILVSIGVLMLAVFLYDWLIHFIRDGNLSEWLEKAIILILNLTIFFIVWLAGFQLFRAVHDSVNYLVPEGKLKNKLLISRGESETISNELEQDGYAAILLPLKIIGWIFGIGLLILFVIGGGALVISGVSSFLASTPTWAIVIIILLLAILYK